MTTNTLDLSSTPFPSVTREDWRRLAESELKGVDLDKKLFSRTPEGLTLEPVYTADHVKGLPGVAGWPGNAPFARGKSAAGYLKQPWKVFHDFGKMPPALWNPLALQGLKSGLEGLKLPHPSTAAELEGYLEGINPANVSLGVMAGRGVSGWLQAWARKNKSDLSSWRGFVEFDPMVSPFSGSTKGLLDEAVGLISDWREAENFHPWSVNGRYWHEAGAHSAQELALILASAADTLRGFEERGVSPGEALGKVTVLLSVGPRFFMEIAKVRAARWVWWLLCSRAGAPAAAKKMSLHLSTSLRTHTRAEASLNILRGTAEAFAGILGQCDSFEIAPFRDAAPGEDLPHRLARNTQWVLREECELTKVVDPLGGSWLVERLTHDLAQKAWEGFQDLEMRGGLLATLKDGFVQDWVGASAQGLQKAVSQRRQVMVGVNQFVGGEKFFPETCPPKAETSPFPPLRLAEPFENLRRRVQAAAPKKGVQVLLVPFGTPKEYKPRLDFSRGFFAAGGFSQAAADGPQEALLQAQSSGAAVVVLCSSDERYHEWVPNLIKEWPSQGRPLFVLAGKPEDQVEVLTQAGIDEFIHLKADALESLERIALKLRIP